MTKYYCPGCRKEFSGHGGEGLLCGDCFLPIIPVFVPLERIPTTDTYFITRILLQQRKVLFRRPASQAAMVDFLCESMLSDKENSLSEYELNALVDRIKYLVKAWKLGLPPFDASTMDCTPN